MKGLVAIRIQDKKPVQSFTCVEDDGVLRAIVHAAKDERAGPIQTVGELVQRADRFAVFCDGHLGRGGHSSSGREGKAGNQANLRGA